jgi:hypothetical protein
MSRLSKILIGNNPISPIVISLVGGLVYLIWTLLWIALQSGYPSNYYHSPGMVLAVLIYIGGLGFLFGFLLCLIASAVLRKLKRGQPSAAKTALSRTVTFLWLGLYLTGLVFTWLEVGMGATG